MIVVVKTVETATSMIAIIPARSGSKKLPGKNKINLAGKPLIAWTIEAALAAQVFTEIIVSTDDIDVAHIAREYSLTVLNRPINLASDTASTSDVILDVFKQLDGQSNNFESFMLLQPTSPLRSSRHINDVFNLFIQTQASSICSV